MTKVLTRNRAKRSRLQRKLLLVFAVTALLLPSARAQETQRAKNLGGKLLCVCGCNQILTACNHVGCTYSHGMLKELDSYVARNEPDDLTLQAFVQEYGPTVLASPPTSGFNRAAWIMPVVVPLFSLYLLWELVRRWRRRAALTTAAGPQISPDLLARAQREAERHDDE